MEGYSIDCPIAKSLDTEPCLKKSTAKQSGKLSYKVKSATQVFCRTHLELQCLNAAHFAIFGTSGILVASILAKYGFSPRYGDQSYALRISVLEKADDDHVFEWLDGFASSHSKNQKFEAIG